MLKLYNLKNYNTIEGAAACLPYGRQAAALNINCVCCLAALPCTIHSNTATPNVSTDSMLLLIIIVKHPLIYINFVTG